MLENFPEATNFQYVDREDVVVPRKRIFMNNVNSYHGSALVKRILDSSADDNVFVVCGTPQKNDEILVSSAVELLNPKAETFFNSVLVCDIVIYDISQDASQLAEAKNFLKHFEANIETVKSRKFVVLISSIMTWALTPQEDEVLTDKHYRKRRPHPCFVNHMIMERDIINLMKKYKNHVSSVVVTPGIIYGGRQDILQIFYKKCYFNNIQLDTFLPAVNRLPLIYLDDYTRIMMTIIGNFPDESVKYVLAIQPQSLQAKDVVQFLSEAAGGSEMRLRLCEHNEIFLMNEKLMTQRVFNHLTLNLRLETEFLQAAAFEMTGHDLDVKSEALAEEFRLSRNLKPIKILIDGSPFAYQTEMAELLANFYSLHRVQKVCFLENVCQRLKRKIKRAEEYIDHMELLKVKYEPISMFDELVEKVKAQISGWQEKLGVICEQLKEETEPKFCEMQNFVLDRLTSFACAKNQGYVMNGFDLDSESASFLFLQHKEVEFEFNESTKPDYVIIMNRLLDQDFLCSDLKERNSIIDEEEEPSEEDETNKQLKDYYDSHYEDVSLLNFFMDHDLIPIEINFEKEITRSYLLELFESIKSKIGSPRNYGLSKEEQDEIDQMKKEIDRKEAEEKAEDERKKAREAKEMEEKRIQEWTNEMMEKKRKEIIEMEKHCLPTRHYLVKYILPNISTALVEIAKLRPNNPVEYLAKLLLDQEHDSNVDEKLDFDIEISNEFKRLGASSPPCDEQMK